MITEDDLKYLRRAGCSESVIEHSKAVAEKAIEIAEHVNVNVDMDLLKKGAINHDIGRSKTHDLDHFVVGADIARDFGFDEDVVRIIERHIGAGILKDEALQFGLPHKDYMPETPEEIIVSYADNITHHVTTASLEETLNKFRDFAGKDHPAIDRIIEQHNLIESWMHK